MFQYPDIQRIRYCFDVLGAVGAGPVPVLDATTDRVFLMQLFHATGGSSWENGAGWGTACPLGEWYGVTVDNEGRVVKLDLHDNNLEGAFNFQIDMRFHPAQQQGCAVDVEQF